VTINVAAHQVRELQHNLAIHNVMAYAAFSFAMQRLRLRQRQ